MLSGEWNSDSITFCASSSVSSATCRVREPRKLLDTLSSGTHHCVTDDQILHTRLAATQLSGGVEPNEDQSAISRTPSVDRSESDQLEKLSSDLPSRNHGRFGYPRGASRKTVSYDISGLVAGT